MTGPQDPAEMSALQLLREVTRLAMQMSNEVAVLRTLVLWLSVRLPEHERKALAGAVRAMALKRDALAFVKGQPDLADADQAQFEMLASSVIAMLHEGQ
jgi:hypothetical protein